MSGLIKNQRAAWLVLLVSSVLTVVAWRLTDGYVADTVRQRFEFRSQEIASVLAKRLKESQTVLRATAGFVSHSERVTRSEWYLFVDALNIQSTYPGMLGVAYLPLITPAELKSHVATQQSWGLNDYRVWPEGARQVYSPIAFLAPDNVTNRSVLGFDAYSDPIRQATMEHARDTGEPAISPRIRLAIRDGVEHSGFAFYMPIYQPNMPIGSIAERRIAIRGYTFSAYQIDEFMRGVGLGNLDTLDLQVFDAPHPAEGSLLHHNLAADHSGPQYAVGDGALSMRIEIPNRPRAWGVIVQARPAFWTTSERLLPWGVALGGAVIDLLLFLTVWSLGRSRSHFADLSDNLKSQLLANEQVLGSAIETMGEAFVIYDPQDRLVFCNERYREIYAISAPAIQLGRTFEEIIRYGAEHGQYTSALGRVDAWVAERMERHRAANHEIVQQLDDGRWIKIRERRTSSGHIVGIRMDLTEVYRAKEAAEAASRAKSRFLATVSHEIRTPMNGILGMAQVLLEPDIPPDKREEHLRTILRAGQALLSLLNDILDLSKVEAGRLELFPVLFSPCDLIEECIRLFVSTAHGKGLNLDWHSTLEASARYTGDIDRLRQMLSNLIGNAIKFTQAGEVLVTGSIIEELPDGVLLEFAVRDTGPGIPAEELGKLFEPFSQLDDSVTRQHGGTGLGLSIVRQLARLMGGTAGVESIPGQGSRFWFRVKVTPHSGGPVTGSASTSSLPGKPGERIVPKLSGRLLLAEDDATHRLVISSALGRLGLSAVEVEDGQAALEAVMSGQVFDLILLDLLMPVMDGLEAMEKIRDWCRLNQRPLPPVLAITAQAYESDREQCLAAGMVDVLTKPVDFRVITTTLAHYLPEADASAHASSMDPSVRNAALDLVRELMPLLAEQKFDSFACLGRLKALLADTEFAASLENASALLNRMAFDQVIVSMNRLVAALTGVKTE